MPSWKKLIISGSDAAIPSVSNTGDFTIDASGDIVLDADGADIVLKDGGTHFGSIKRVTSDLVIKSETQDKDILFKGNDGGSTITALQIDMSELGRVKLPNDNQYLTFGAGGDGVLYSVNDDFYISNFTAGQDTIFQNLNSAGSSYVTNLFIDGSEERVGINTSSPSAKLHINQDASAGALLVQGGGGGQYLGRFQRDVGGSSYVDIHCGSDDPQITFTTTAAARQFSIGADSSGHKFLISENSSIGTTDRLTIDDSGNALFNGNISGSQIEASGDVIAFGTSDERLKDNITPISEPLYKLSKVGGYTFDWNDKQDTYEGHDVGVIAQEIQEVLPEVVTERDNGYLAVKYEKIVPLLIESIKELKQEIDDIKQKCDCLNK